MKIACPACRARFRLDAHRVTRPGVKARCGECTHVFHVDPPGMDVREIAEAFIADCLLLDMEAAPDGRIFAMGAVLGDEIFERTDRFDLQTALADLERFGQDATFVLGHNLLAHDLPVLTAIQPDLDLLRLPVIDTLYLSPLAFPENPYHRLVKDYKLVRHSRNHPVSDARLAGTLFLDQWESFSETARALPDLLAFHEFCFRDARLDGGADAGGIRDLFRRLGAPLLPDAEAALSVFRDLAGDRICEAALTATVRPLLDDPSKRTALAYCLAWLRVAGGNSVLPPWVRYRFPGVAPTLKALRDIPCGSERCAWCAEVHNPRRQLQRYFGFGDFRTLPDGEPLQEEIVRNGMGDRPLLGILPTGFGKSICFQLPALIRFHRRGALTVVISPLQSLMKDQVDNLKRVTGTPAAGAIYGLLTGPERGAVLEGVRMGDIGILYISPEQLRNRSVREALKLREIGCWVFDEAHCLSKWGHDFRPDYLYAARFIREFAEAQGTDIPPVAGFTATAKLDVIAEIVAHFREQLGQDLVVLQGGVERENLRFGVEPVTEHEKPGRIADLLADRLGNPPAGSAVIYCATRSHTELMADFLAQKGWTAEAFHGGLTPPDKRRVQDLFIAGDVPVICATNAFGMGIDKPDVRLVIHADIPGSLENYLQEAGRAGRDLQIADCVLLYHKEDIETQFQLGALSELRHRDLVEILRAFRRAKRSPTGEVVTTTGEVLRDEETRATFDWEDHGADTKVRTAVAWLERSGHLERNENQTYVFQGKPRFKTLSEARDRLDRLDLPPVKRRIWETVLSRLMDCDPDDGLTTDDLAEAVGRLEGVDKSEFADSRAVIGVLHQMAEAGVVDSGILMSAYVRPKGRDSARKLLTRICDLDRALLGILREEHPDETVDEWVSLNLRNLNQRLVDAGFSDANPETVKGLLASLARDGKGFAGRHGSIDLRHAHQEHYRVRLRRQWTAIAEIADRRRNLAWTLLNALYERIPGDMRGQAEILVEFSSDDLAEAIRRDMTLQVAPEKILPAIDRGLLFLHEQNVILLQKGLSVFRQAMKVRMLPEARGRRYAKGDYAPLAHHYGQRTFQVHVMEEYARRGLEAIGRALALVTGYFTMDNRRFIRRYFPDRRDMLQRSTGEESYKKIVDSLKHPVQEAVVAGDPEENGLILAGPGSGKTRTVVHRCAYLLRVRRVPSKSVLVLLFNHGAALSVRRRLRDLVGRDAAGVTVLTYHGLAMRLTGTSFATRADAAARDEAGLTARFDAIIRDAASLLEGEKSVPGLAPDEIRDRLLSGYRHILVDEYQDIDADQYRLISALAGRTLKDPDGKLSILAVGDDDQSIYGFRGANVEFIRRFREDYRAEVHYLVENFRSTAHIIVAANALIRRNRDRVKTDHPIRIDRRRKTEPPGGRWAALDPVGQGRVQRIAVDGVAGQASALVAELWRFRTLDPSLDWADVAVLSRQGFHYAELCAVRAALESVDIPCSRPLERDSGFPLHRVREIAVALDDLSQLKNEIRTATDLIERHERRIGERPDGRETVWDAEVRRLLSAWETETGDAEVSVGAALDFIYESLSEQRREQRLGRGVFLATAHAAKGLEFPHVFILDGGWRAPPETAAMEEERRLFYVAMTRAMETLTVFRREDCRNPHLNAIDGLHLLDRRGDALPELETGAFRRYEILGLGQLYLDFAGCCQENAPVHEALSKLNAGDPLTMRVDDKGLELVDINGLAVARLSRSAETQWRDRVGDIETIAVIAMARRQAGDAKPDFRGRLRCGEWEVPVVEVCFRGL